MGHTILLADDNLDDRTIYAVILEHHGYHVLLAANGEEAVRMASEQRPDLMLMDLVMPLVDGLAATRRLKEDPATAGIPVVMITAHALTGVREKAEAAGCDAFLFKPVAPRRVIEEVRRHLRALP